MTDSTALLNIVSTGALVGALIFAARQVEAANKSRTETAAIAIINTAQSEAWTQALRLLYRIPPGASAEEIDALGESVVAAIEDVGIRMETIGYMVYRRIVTMETVEDLVGGVVLFWWSRIKPFAERDRERTQNPKSYEWVQWLAERLADRRVKADPEPAYVRHTRWRAAPRLHPKER